MKLEAIAQGLLGAIFGVRAFDDKKPLWARAGYGIVAFDLVKGSIDSLRTGAVRTPGLADVDDAGIGQRKLKPLQFAHHRVKTIQDRVAYVHKQMIASTRDPEVYKLARLATSKRVGDAWQVEEKDHAGEATAIFNEVRKRVRYTWDPTDYDAFQTAIRTLELHSGDCDDMTILLGALCRTVGHKVRSRIVQTKGSDTWNHIYLMMYAENWKNDARNVHKGDPWMPLDASVNKPAGWEVPDAMVLKRKDFEVPSGD